MKISEAIQRLTTELRETGDSEVHLETATDYCLKHPTERRASCAFCDLCEHGVNRNTDCRLCHINDSDEWQRDPITDIELVTLINELRSGDHYPFRYNPQRLRNFRGVDRVSLAQLVVLELMELRRGKQKAR